MMIRAFVLTILSPSLGKIYSRFEASEDPEDMLAGGCWIYIQSDGDTRNSMDEVEV